MNYPDPIRRLLTDDAFDRYAKSTAGNPQSLADLQALGTDSILAASNNAAASGKMGSPGASGAVSKAMPEDVSQDIDQNIDQDVHQRISQGVAEEMAAACLSGLWLLHNHLDASHDISQSIASPAGSHWHAIMHRLEGDFSNSKYWYRRVGQWPVYDQVAEISGQPFDPIALVDQVQSLGSDATHQIAVAEWQALFAFCYQRANG